VHGEARGDDGDVVLAALRLLERVHVGVRAAERHVHRLDDFVGAQRRLAVGEEEVAGAHAALLAERAEHERGVEREPDRVEVRDRRGGGDVAGERGGGADRRAAEPVDLVDDRLDGAAAVRRRGGVGGERSSQRQMAVRWTLAPMCSVLPASAVARRWSSGMREESTRSGKWEALKRCSTPISELPATRVMGREPFLSASSSASERGAIHSAGAAPGERGRGGRRRGGEPGGDGGGGGVAEVGGEGGDGANGVGDGAVAGAAAEIAVDALEQAVLVALAGDGGGGDERHDEAGRTKPALRGERRRECVLNRMESVTHRADALDGADVRVVQREERDETRIQGAVFRFHHAAVRRPRAHGDGARAAAALAARVLGAGQVRFVAQIFQQRRRWLHARCAVDDDAVLFAVDV
jgi:hypothetical protein